MKVLFLEVPTEVEELMVIRNGYADSNYYGWFFPISHGGALYCKPNSNFKVNYSKLELVSQQFFGRFIMSMGRF